VELKVTVSWVGSYFSCISFLHFKYTVCGHKSIRLAKNREKHTKNRENVDF
jgi:hypothetical protein